MPLKTGSSQKTISGNIEEMLHRYHESGRIGHTTPKSAEHARKIAAAAAYNKARSHSTEFTTEITRLTGGLKRPA